MSTSSAIKLGGVIAGVLSDLTDCDTSGATNGQVLTYNNGTGEWEPGSGSGVTLDSAYDGGSTITADAGAVTINTSGTSGGLLIDGTGSGLLLDVQQSSNSCMKVESDGDVYITPQGSNGFSVNTSSGPITLDTTSQLISFQTTTSGNIEFQSAGTINMKTALTIGTGGTEYTLPVVDGTTDYVLQTNGSGTVSWAAMTGGASSLQDAYDGGETIDISTVNGPIVVTIDDDIDATAALYIVNDDVTTPSSSIVIEQNTTHTYAYEAPAITITSDPGSGPHSILGNRNLYVWAVHNSSSDPSELSLWSYQSGSDEALATLYAESDGGTATTTVAAYGHGSDGYVILQASDAVKFLNIASQSVGFIDTTDRYGIAFGRDALDAIASSGATNNIAIGRLALTDLVTGTDNIAIGQYAAANLNGESYGIYIGYAAGYTAVTGDNVAIGYEALYNVNDASSGNTALGHQALKISTGLYNVAVGYQAATAGDCEYVTAVGYQACENVAANHNTGIGYLALSSASGSSSTYNTAIGSQAAEAVTSGSGNVAVGAGAMVNSSTGDYNTVVGKDSGILLGAGSSQNVLFGYSAGSELRPGSTYNVCIGASSGGRDASTTGQVCLGNRAGDNTTSASNELWIANSNTATPLIYGHFTSNLLTLRATVTVGDGTGNGQYTLPADDGTTNQVLQTNGSGTVSWAAMSGGASQLSDLSDVGTTSYGNGKILIADTDSYEEQTVSGAVTLSETGVVGFIATEETSIASDDLVLIYDTSESVYRNMTRANFVAGLSTGESLDDAYNNGISITADSGAVAITVPDDSDNAGLSITQSDDTNNPNGLVISNAGSGASINLTGAGSRKIVSDSAGLTISTTTSGDLTLSAAGSLHLNKLTVNSAYTLPTADGTTDYVLQTNGSGTVSWAAMSGGASQLSDLSDVGTTTATSGNLLIADGDSWESVDTSGALDLSSSGVFSFPAAATTDVDVADLLLVYDDSGTAYKRMTRANLFKLIVTDVSSSTYTADDDDQVILADATSNNIVVTLTTGAGRVFHVKKVDSSSNTVTLSPSSGNIDGGSTKVLASQYNSFTVACDGTNWWVL